MGDYAIKVAVPRRNAISLKRCICAIKVKRLTIGMPSPQPRILFSAIAKPSLSPDSFVIRIPYSALLRVVPKMFIQNASNGTYASRPAIPYRFSKLLCVSLPPVDVNSEGNVTPRTKKKKKEKKDVSKSLAK